MRSGTRAAGALFVVGFAIAACTSAGTSRWLGPGLHVVDGYLVTTETPCPLDGDADCAADVEAALAELPPGVAGRVTAAAVVEGPTGYLDRAGNTILLTVAGLARASAVAFTLDDGSRRVVTLICEPKTHRADGTVVDRRSCSPGPPWMGLPRAGDEPPG